MNKQESTISPADAAQIFNVSPHLLSEIDHFSGVEIENTSLEFIQKHLHNIERMILPRYQFMGNRLVDYLISLSYHVDTTPGHINILYIEGITPDFRQDPDRPNLWNDLRIVFTHTPNGLPMLLGKWIATTEPGTASTFSAQARRLGGVARIRFGQYTAWRVGYHKPARLGKSHPALVQCAPVPVHRDRNRDEKRTGDPLDLGRGINQHSTHPAYVPGVVAGHSAGCLVGCYWHEHLEFMKIVQTDPRYLADNKFVFTTTVIAGDDFLKSLPA
jgi:hypothetical protein